MVRGANRRGEDTRRAQPPLLRLPIWAAVSDSGSTAYPANAHGRCPSKRQPPQQAGCLVAHFAAIIAVSAAMPAALPPRRRRPTLNIQGMPMSLRLERMLAIDAAIRSVLAVPSL